MRKPAGTTRGTSQVSEPHPASFRGALAEVFVCAIFWPSANGLWPHLLLPRKSPNNAEREESPIAPCCYVLIPAVLARFVDIMCSLNRIVIGQRLGSAFPHAVRSSASAGTCQSNHFPRN
jgi:hypothetical protein